MNLENIYEDVQEKLKKKNKILFSRNSKCLQALIGKMEKQSHRVLILWAFECVRKPLTIIESKYENERRPRQAVELCEQWAQGKIKMPIAKKAILNCHAVCKEIENERDIALCHAIGQAVSTVHVGTHALGLPFYELTAIVLENKEDFEEKIEQKIQYYLNTLQYFESNMGSIPYTWAEFLKV